MIEELQSITPDFTTTEIDNFGSEGEFMHAYVELHKQTSALLYFIVGYRYCDKDGMPVEISKDEAVLGGNIVRLIKLNTSFIQNTCEGKLEICSILSRCIAETSINIEYMLMEDEERVLRNYIKYSLITEKELWNTIKENVEKRGGDSINIEERMKASIQRSFDKSDFDLDDVNRSSKWKSISKRAERVYSQMFYDVFYGIASHSIHGNWQDIYTYHLEKREDSFVLNLEWTHARPQIVDGPIFLNLSVAKSFATKESLGQKDLILEKIEVLSEYHKYLEKAHETSLSQQ